MLDKIKQTLKQMDKKKLITLGILAAVILIVGIFAGIGISAITKEKQHTVGNVATPEDATGGNTISNSNATSNQPTDLAYSKKEDEPSAIADFAKTNTWESDGKKFAQIDVTVKNAGVGKITDWTMTFTLGANASIEQSWNCVLETNKNGDILEVQMKPVDYNKNIEVGEGTQGIGFIVGADTDVNVGKYSIETTVDGVTMVADGGEEHQDDETASTNNEENTDGNNNTNNGNNQGNTDSNNNNSDDDKSDD